MKDARDENGFAGELLGLTRLHIVAIASLGTLTFGWLFTGVHAPALALFAAVDWFLVNLVNRVVDLPEDRLNDIPGTAFASRHRRGLVAASIAVLVGSFVASHAVAPAITPLRLAYHLLGLVYNYRLIPLPGGRRTRLKEVYLAKNTASALGFLITVFGYPLAALADRVRVGPAYVAVVAVFFFLSEISYEVVYDLRDVPGDRAAGVPTFPVVHGPRVTRAIVFALLGGSAVALAGGYLAGLVDWAAFVMISGLAIQLAMYVRFERRGVRVRDCIVLTLIGASLLAAYNVWVLAGLPLVEPWR